MVRWILIGEAPYYMKYSTLNYESRTPLATYHGMLPQFNFIFCNQIQLGIHCSSGLALALFQIWLLDRDMMKRLCVMRYIVLCYYKHFSSDRTFHELEIL